MKRPRRNLPCLVSKNSPKKWMVCWTSPCGRVWWRRYTSPQHTLSTQHPFKMHPIIIHPTNTANQRIINTPYQYTPYIALPITFIHPQMAITLFDCLFAHLTLPITSLPLPPNTLSSHLSSHPPPDGDGTVRLFV